MESGANIEFFWFNINLFNVGSLQILEHFQAVVFRRTLRTHYNNWAACKHCNNTEWVSTYKCTYNSYPLIPLFVHICHKNLAQDSSSYIVIKWSAPDQEMTSRLLACFGRHFWPNIFIFSFICRKQIEKSKMSMAHSSDNTQFCIKGADFSAEYHSFRKLTTSSKASNHFHKFSQILFYQIEITKLPNVSQGWCAKVNELFLCYLLGFQQKITSCARESFLISLLDKQLHLQPWYC